MVIYSYYLIESTSNGININLDKILKDSWLNDNNQCLLDIASLGVNEQQFMEEIFTQVEEVAIKSLKPRQ